MNAGATARVQRPELEEDLGHINDVVSKVDFSGVTEPRNIWQRAVLATVRYSDVGQTVDLTSVTLTPLHADGVPAERVTAERADERLRLVFFHGGGRAAGSPKDYITVSGMLARLSASILMVDFQLAPENPYPAGLDDCVRAYKRALDNSPSSLKDREPAESVASSATLRAATSRGDVCLRGAARKISAHPGAGQHD